MTACVATLKFIQTFHVKSCRKNSHEQKLCVQLQFGSQFESHLKKLQLCYKAWADVSHFSNADRKVFQYQRVEYESLQPLYRAGTAIHVFMFGNHVVMFGAHGMVYKMHVIHVCPQKYLDVRPFYLSMVSI